ncbi:hypothetical protein PMKS-001450 [Pichia membranifaciens]|uniref:FCP1 homology domain-containing protein n=1 Tax=Pichia membranifaciens TaxID=4926 RepID=A0A1Q2YEJ9_9ASCO|nr:hypothetical protein PMKS-001450 [Pichia membranifaciens]
MSFLSTLFCCFDAEDSAVKENNTKTTHPKLTKTQSNLQRALTNSKPDSNPSLNLNRSNSPAPPNHAGAGNSNKSNQAFSATKKGQSDKSTSNSNTTATGHTNTGSSNTDKKKNIANGNKQSGANKGNSSANKNTFTGTSAAHLDNPQSQAPSKNMDVQSRNKASHKMSYSDSNSTTHHVSNDDKEMAEEITDLKDSTDSSKDEDDAYQIHEHQTQNTDETDLNHQPEIRNRASNEVVAEDKIVSDHGRPATPPNQDSNPISNLNPDSTVNELNYEEQLYDEQFGTSLTEILPDQVVSSSGWLLDAQPKQLKGRKCLVLDLDETLVHSSFKYVRQCDFVIPVEIEDQIHNVYVIKRPGVDQFLKKVGELYEVVVFTASVSRYGDPLLDILDTHKSVHHRLFRESCYNYQGNYIKNLSQMGRPLEDLIIIDNSPASYVFHPQHAVPISSWFSDSHDCELTDLLPFLEDLAKREVDDIRLVLDINI